MTAMKNSKGEVFYGMHFYPGLARYQEPGQEPFTVFLNENTIRNMSPSFAGCPIYVEHVDDVNEDLDALRGEADGWVMESFYNAADGKTWAKFVVVSEKGLNAIRNGWRLSNAFFPTNFKPGGQWNGIPYQKEVVAGEFEHLAIVQNPRYEESVIMTPEEFKKYNDTTLVELKKLSNSKGESKMKFWKRAKVENAADIKDLGEAMVTLEKSKKDMSIKEVVEEYDKILNMNGYANGDHMVKVGNDEMSVNDLVKKHLEMSNSAEEAKKNAKPDDEDAVENAEDEDDESMDNEVDASVGDRGGDKSLNNEDDEDDAVENAEDDEDDDKDKKKNEKVKNAKSMTLDEARKVLAKEKAKRLKNANNQNAAEEVVAISLPADQVARGKTLYGSGR